MDFKLTEEQLLVKKMVEDFVERELAPIASEIDKEDRFPVDIIRKLARLNLMGINIPVEWAGGGSDSISYTIMIEELAKASGATAAIVAAHHLVGETLSGFGTESLKQKYLIPLAKGEKLGAFALTEPEAESDISAIQTTAVRDNDFWVLNGTKGYIVNGSEAQVICVFAATDKSKGLEGISAFVVDKNSPGFSVSKTFNKLGIRGCPVAELTFKDCKLPKENILGKEGEGFRIANSALDSGRIGIAALAVGIAQASLDESISYAKQRKQFGRPICEFQAIQWMLANLATELEAARMLVYKAAYTKDSQKQFTKEASMAKLYASDVAVRAAIKAVQIYGGYGYTKDYPVERFFRDAKLTELCEGTSEMQRLIIASNLLKR